MWAMAWSLLQPRFQWSWDAVCNIQIQNEYIFTKNNTFISLNIRYVIYALCKIEYMWIRRFRWCYYVFIKHPNFLGITVLRNQKKKLKKAHMLKGCAAGFRVVWSHHGNYCYPWSPFASFTRLVTGCFDLPQATFPSFLKKSKSGRD